MPHITLKRIIVWGFILWLIGYILGIVFYMMLPPQAVGWAIMPIGIGITIWVLCKKFRDATLRDFFTVASVWTLIAVVCDYLFLVLLFKPADGYYKLDVYIYYATTFLLPIVVGYVMGRKKVVHPLSS